VQFAGRESLVVLNWGGGGVRSRKKQKSFLTKKPEKKNGTWTRGKKKNKKTCFVRTSRENTEHGGGGFPKRMIANSWRNWSEKCEGKK